MRHEIMQLGPLLPETTRALSDSYVVHRYDLAEDKEALLTRLAPGLRAIATRGDYHLGADIMAKLPGLKLIASSGAGYDGIDVAAAAARGITVTNTPGVLSECVADMALALILTTVRRTIVFDRFVREGRWKTETPSLGQRVWGEPIGIIGLGGIGKAIARRAAAMQMPVFYHGRREQPDQPWQWCPDPVAMAKAVRFLVISVPGGAATAGLVSKEMIEALGPEGYLFNVARGSVVDQDALIEALVSRRIAGAGLDVFADEPHVPEALTSLDTVVLQPHIGSGSTYTRAAMGQMLVDNLAAFFAHSPLISPLPARSGGGT